MVAICRPLGFGEPAHGKRRLGEVFLSIEVIGVSEPRPRYWELARNNNAAALPQALVQRSWMPSSVPHLARSLVGPDFSRLIPTAAILGGGYLLLIDTLARTAAQIEIPLGILTAVIGTPFFIWLLTSMQKTWS